MKKIPLSSGLILQLAVTQKCNRMVLTKWRHFVPKHMRFKSEKYSNRFVVLRLQDGNGIFGIGIWGCFNFNGVGVCNIYTD